MIRSVTIKGYRGLEHLEMSNLGRINLLVGKNNSGKSSVLEALYLLELGGHPTALLRVLTGRGEIFDMDSLSRERPEPEFDISHLFYGHDLTTKTPAEVSAKNDSTSHSLKLQITEVKGNKEGDETLFPTLTDDDEASSLSRVGLAVSDSASENGFGLGIKAFFRLSAQGGIRMRDLDVFRRLPRGSSEKPRVVRYVATESLTPRETTAFWDKIVLTEHENKVLEALNYIDPTIERIASLGGPQMQAMRYVEARRGGFKVKISDQKSPVPIGVLGDGVWRMLAIAIALVSTQDGVLLIDEIDTGLHYSVMEDLWRLIAKTAKELNVQVFATTHSYDCITSLASICRADPGNENEVTIQRIEAGKTRSVAYDEGDIRVAAERHIEMR